MIHQMFAVIGVLLFRVRACRPSDLTGQRGLIENEVIDDQLPKWTIGNSRIVCRNSEQLTR